MTGRLSRGMLTFTAKLGKKAREPIESWLSRSSLVDDQPFLDPALFRWTDDLEHNWGAIRKELDAVLEDQSSLPSIQDISVLQKRLSDDDRWKTFFFFGYGFKAQANCARCPRTSELLETIPGMKTAFFSILAAGKRIPPHRGPFKGVLRYHLGLKVPAHPVDSCGIRVGTETRHWVEGRSLLFDDTYEHEAWNYSDDLRVVLFLDVVRPLRQPTAAINNLLLRIIAMSPYVRDAKNRHNEWERRQQH